MWPGAEKSYLVEWDLSTMSLQLFYSAIIMVVLFSRLRLSGTIISKIAPLAFGVYLFQNNSVIWEQIKGKFAFVAQMPVGLGVSCVLGIAFGIFTVGIIVEAIRKRLETILHIPALSKKIVWFADQILEKISTLVL